MPTSHQQARYALTTFPSPLHRPTPTHEPDDLNPDSSASLLRRHRHPRERPAEDRLNTTPLQTESGTGILARLSSAMSRNSLLSRSGSTQGPGSYGLVPNSNAANDPPDRDDVDGAKGRDWKKANSSALGVENPARGSRFSRHRHGSGASSRDTTNGIGRTMEGDEAENPGDETMDVDGDGSDGNPPDDSP